MTIELKDANEKTYFVFESLEQAKNALITCHLPYLNVYKDGEKLTHKNGKGLLIYTNKYQKGESYKLDINGTDI